MKLKDTGLLPKREDCHSSFCGGYTHGTDLHNKQLEAFHHGMDTVFNILDECGEIEVLERLDEEKLEIEEICEAVHKAYCKYHIEHKGTEYWTKGDYSKLNEEGKEYDRRTVKAVIRIICQKFDTKK